MFLSVLPDGSQCHFWPPMAVHFLSAATIEFPVELADTTYLGYSLDFQKSFWTTSSTVAEIVHRTSFTFVRESFCRNYCLAKLPQKHIRMYPFITSRKT